MQLHLQHYNSSISSVRPSSDNGYTIMADRDPVTRDNRYPKLELVRLAIPRRTYTLSHMEYVAVALKNIYDTRHEAKFGYEIKWEAPIMRHFTVELEKIGIN